jgi:hypothetical protein
MVNECNGGFFANHRLATIIPGLLREVPSKTFVPRFITIGFEKSLECFSALLNNES